MNTTDLRLKYHMETGENPEWGHDWANSGIFHKEEAKLDRDYALWLEEQLLNFLNDV